MKELLSSVENLATEELIRSYEKFPAFNSPHEGYAVIKEEVEEAEEEIKNVSEGLECLWNTVRCNCVSPIYVAKIRGAALHAAAEAIQVAAMAQKFINSGCASEKSGDPNAE